MPSAWLMRRVAIVSACALAGCAASTGAGAARAATTRRPTRRAATPVVITIDPGRRSGRIGSDLVGLSLESFDVNSAWLDPGTTSIAALLSNLGASRLRIGGTESGIYWQ